MAKVIGLLAFIALLVYAGVSLWYGRVEKQIQGKNPIVSKEAAIPSAQQPTETEFAKTDYQIILSRNIFKAALESGGQTSGEQPPTDVEDLAETKMQLVLLGTVSGSKEDARAIIRNEKARIEDIYRVGSELHGAIITRIGRGKVVLQVNGREEVLNIKEPEGGHGPQQVGSPAADVPQPIMQTDGSRTRPAPVVVPQRRISFRNPAPVVSEPEPAAPVPEDSGTSAPAGEPTQQGGNQPVLNDETSSPGSSGMDENAAQQAQ